jgi:hypothetical protein
MLGIAPSRPVRGHILLRALFERDRFCCIKSDPSPLVPSCFDRVDTLQSVLSLPQRKVAGERKADSVQRAKPHFPCAAPQHVTINPRLRGFAIPTVDGDLNGSCLCENPSVSGSNAKLIRTNYRSRTNEPRSGEAARNPAHAILWSGFEDGMVTQLDRGPAIGGTQLVILNGN